MLVSSTTRQAVSNGMVRFSITQTISPKSQKYWNFYIKMSVFWASGEDGLGYGESDHTIEYRSSSCIRNKHEKLGIMFLDEYATIY
jgi:hypothetical protein